MSTKKPAKDVVATRAVAKAEATNDWSRVTDRHVKLAAQATDLGKRAAAIAKNQQITIDDLALEHETQATVADLDVDHEVVRSLADAGMGDDPFGFDDMPSDINMDEEAAAAARLDKQWTPGKTVTLSVGVGYAGPGVNLPGSTAQGDRIRELEAEIADMKTAYSTSLRVAQDATSKAQADLDGIAGILEHAKITIVNLQGELDKLRTEATDFALGINDEVVRLRRENKRMKAEIVEFNRSREFWAAFKAVFVDPNGKKGAR